MAQVFLVTLSEANSNDLGAQKWLLGWMCNRVQALGHATLTTMNSTWDDMSRLVNTVCRLYAATGCDFHEVNDLLQEKLQEVEGRYEPETIKRAQEQWEARPQQFYDEHFKLQCDRQEELMDRPLRYFWKPRR